MTIKDTKSWLLNYFKNDESSFNAQSQTLIEPIRRYFNNQSTIEIQQLLLSHGLFQPEQTKLEQLERWIKEDIWQLIQEQYQQLKKEWQGPDLAIFIFPADLNNQVLTKQFKGVSGLCFKDKMILFIDHQASEQMINAIFAHEYSHAVRLNEVHHREDILTLKDTIILEGIAEIVTEEKFGASLLPDFDDQSKNINKLISQWIKPYLSLSTNHPLHHYIMYGNSSIPKFTGYQAGIFIVKQWHGKHATDLIDLLQTPTEHFFKDL